MTEKKMAYYQSVKFLRRWLRPNTVVYFDELMDQHKLWKENPEKFEDIVGAPFKGVFYRSRKNIAENTSLKKGAQLAAEEILKDMGLLTVIYQPDHPNWYKIDFKKLTSLHQEYQEEKARMKNEKSAIILPLNYDEITADYEELDEVLYNNQTTSHPETVPAPIQNTDRIKNRRLKIDNKNKVSKDTYVPDGIDAFQELGLGSIYTKNSCIKKKESAPPPGAHAQSGTDFDEALDIIDEYNRAMDIIITPGEKEMTTTLENLDKLRKVRKYFNSDILNKVWNQYGDDYTNNLEHRRISAFIKCGLMAKLKSHHLTLSKTHDDEIDGLLDKIYRKYGNQISSIIEDQGYLNNFGSLEPINASTHFPPKEHRRVRLQLYHQHIKGLLPKEEKHDMMKLEV